MLAARTQLPARAAREGVGSSHARILGHACMIGDAQAGSIARAVRAGRGSKACNLAKVLAQHAQHVRSDALLDTSFRRGSGASATPGCLPEQARLKL